MTYTIRFVNFTLGAPFKKSRPLTGGRRAASVLWLLRPWIGFGSMYDSGEATENENKDKITFVKWAG